MMDSVYLETTVIGNIAGRLHPDPVIAARQIVTRKWWAKAFARYELFASALVIDECRGGGADAAKERLAVLDGIPLLGSSTEAETLVEALLNGKAVPRSEPRDATHIAIAAANGINYLASWNFKHILNPGTMRTIESVCRSSGFDPPMLVTPEQLFEAFDDS
ncbi:MAG TPA: type II toxin-antitoxin system VapC family toxin [Pirellulaceae bacterium]|nr:type II toxin-antitoxin system VapC family toxin [Pirellulaceae bacterium]HMO91791.1 type II toxin-antitoxin system VapC family toxin [Pirellulaceae bacterium]HMP69590.1 type II toxin-antitoxin system VapC family toxin [Pirellulaceae bacterium]